MLYVITCKDKPDHIPICIEYSLAHVTFLKTHLDKILFARQTLNSSGDPSGSALIFNVDRLAEVET
jgi:hypothetical protein